MKLKCVRPLLAVATSIIVQWATIAQSEFYIPKSLLVPVHTHQNELHASLGWGGGLDGNVSYAFTKHFALFTTGTLSKGTSYRPGFILGGKHYIHKNDYAIKGGIGYFTAIKSKTFNYFEMYAGVGNYKVDNYWYFPGSYPGDTQNGYDTRARFRNVFYQVQITQKSPRSEITFALRMAYCWYQYLEYQDRYNSGGYMPPSAVSLPGIKGLTFDPAVNGSYLVGKFKLNAQIGISKLLNTTKISGNGGTTEIGVGAFFGRIAIQRNFDFRSKNSRK